MNKMEQIDPSKNFEPPSTQSKENQNHKIITWESHSSTKESWPYQVCQDGRPIALVKDTKSAELICWLFATQSFFIEDEQKSTIQVLCQFLTEWLREEKNTPPL